MTRLRPCLLCCALLLAGLARAAEPGAATPRSVAVLEFELIDDMREYESAEVLDAQSRRLVQISDALRQELAQRGLYRVVDDGPAHDLITGFKARQELRECNGCEVEIGKALGADVVIIGWVQKVSNLILNINVQARDVATGATLYARSVDLRSNTETSWLRGIHYMVDGIAEDKDYLR
jgi:hypothetical protein